MNDLCAYNRERWNALAQANVLHSRPYLNFTAEQAASYVSFGGVITDLAGKEILCLAGGGGQDSVAFGLLGARVTVLDLSDVQLERDRQAALHHGLGIETVQGDMRDLSMFPDCRFDLVWQPYSINYVPILDPVFEGVARLLKPSGFYRLCIANPFTLAMSSYWEGQGYPLRGQYIDGEDVTHFIGKWDIEQPDGSTVSLEGPRQFRHTLSTTLNRLTEYGFALMRLQEWMRTDANPEPGSWPHFTQAAPPYLDILCRRMIRSRQEQNSDDSIGRRI